MFHPGVFQRKDSDIEYLEDQLKQYQDNERQRQEEDNERRRQRDNDRHRYLEAECRSAETWPEALRKQESLFTREVVQWEDETSNEVREQFPDNFFGPGAKACNRALEIWQEVEASKQAKIEKLQKQLKAIQDEIRLDVARQLALENDMPGWKSVASAIERDTLENWLNW